MHPNAVYIIGTPQGQTTRLLYEKLLQYDTRIKLHHPSTGCVTEAHRNGVRTIVIAADPELPLQDMPAILKAARPLGICFLVVGDKAVWEKTVPLSLPEVAELDVVSPDSDWETPLLPPPPNITLTIESINGISVTRDIPAPDTMEPLVDLQEEMEDIISPTTTVVVENTEPEADGEDIRNSARLVITVIILLTIILGVLIYVIMACLAPSVPTQSTAPPLPGIPTRKTLLTTKLPRPRPRSTASRQPTTQLPLPHPKNRKKENLRQARRRHQTQLHKSYIHFHHQALLTI